jgi:ATP phosphoribosyltransferase regulatory subunit
MSDQLRRQRPHGLNDLFYEQAAIKTGLEELLLDTFALWGYQRIILPTFGYYESLSAGTSPEIQRQMYRFFDREGNVLALRADMTVPTARLVATRLYDQPLPLRFCYAGSVFRHEQPQAGQRHEFTQAGIELIGAATPEADAEVVALAIAALQALGITEFQINLGQVAYLRALMEDIGLQNGGQYELEQAIGRKNDVEVAATLERLQVTGEAARLIRALPHLYGGVEILPRARELATNPGARAAVAYLEDVYGLLVAQGVAEHIILDLGEIRGMAYHTGIAFRGYVRGLGFHVCSGGRYDDLMAQFGSSLPAVGFALGIERAMLASPFQADVALDLLLSCESQPDGYAVAARARALGLQVEIDVLRRRGDDLLQYGRAKRARHIVTCDRDGRCMLYARGAEQRDTEHVVTLAEIQEEMAQWRR